MLVAYILTKSRFLRVKLIRNKESGVFKKGGFEYKIDRKRIYTKKAFGIKLFFWAMYLEGNPNPIEFDDKGITVSQADVPLDEIAILVRKIVHGFMEILTLVLVAFTFLLTIAIAWKVFELG